MQSSTALAISKLAGYLFRRRPLPIGLVEQVPKVTVPQMEAIPCLVRHYLPRVTTNAALTCDRNLNPAGVTYMRPRWVINAFGELASIGRQQKRRDR